MAYLKLNTLCDTMGGDARDAMADTSSIYIEDSDDELTPFALKPAPSRRTLDKSTRVLWMCTVYLFRDISSFAGVPFFPVAFSLLEMIFIMGVALNLVNGDYLPWYVVFTPIWLDCCARVLLTVLFVRTSMLRPHERHSYPSNIDKIVDSVGSAPLAMLSLVTTAVRSFTLIVLCSAATDGPLEVATAFFIPLMVSFSIWAVTIAYVVPAISQSTLSANEIYVASAALCGLVYFQGLLIWLKWGNFVYFQWHTILLLPSLSAAILCGHAVGGLLYSLIPHLRWYDAPPAAGDEDRPWSIGYFDYPQILLQLRKILFTVFYMLLLLRLGVDTGLGSSAVTAVQTCSWLLIFLPVVVYQMMQVCSSTMRLCHLYENWGR